MLTHSHPPGTTLIVDEIPGRIVGDDDWPPGRVLHLGPNGETLMRKVDFDQVSSLKQPDVFIHDGDVVEVGTSVPRMIPWVGYQFIKTVIHVGYKVAP